MNKGGGKNEEAIQSINDIRFPGRDLCNSKMVIIYKSIPRIKEVGRMKKLYRVLMILGSLVGICATVRW